MTEQEVIKKFEELGYEYKKLKEYPDIIYLTNDANEPKQLLSIKINTKVKKYLKVWGDLRIEPITFKEHQLLTELFKCWEWI